MIHVNATASVLFTLFYAIFCTGFIFQFREFSGIGLSPENILSSFVQCSEEILFLEFHLKKTAGTLVLWTLMPLGFFLGNAYCCILLDQSYNSLSAFLNAIPQGQILLTIAMMLPISSGVLVYFWSLDNWSRHPFVQKFLTYSRDGDWRSVCGDINTEFRRIDKFTIGTNPMMKIVVTENWIIFVGQSPWSLKLAHQSDVSLTLIQSEQHALSTDGQIGGSQFLTIQVQNRRPNAESFTFRLNSLDYQNLTDKLRSSVANVKNIQIFKTVSERFVEVFREEVNLNPKVSLTDDEGEIESCIGCMVVRSNVKLVRRCETDGVDNPCVNCYCRPMWCIDCMAKWFASRQNQEEPETWLSSKCPCPTCRSKFCLLDVALIQ